MYTQHLNTKKTNQNQPISGKDMVQNSDGGFVFKIEPIERIKRFLVLGSAGGTYYASEKKLTIQNANSIIDLIKSQNGKDVVPLILNYVEQNRIPKRNTAFFTLALCSSFGDKDIKKQSYDAISKICFTGTDLFTYCQYIQDLRGWSRGLRTGVAKFYTDKSLEQVAYQAVKYRQRDGWTHRDVIRLSHAPGNEEFRDNLYKYIIGKEFDFEKLPATVRGYELASKEKNVKEILKLISTYRLTWEMIPTDFLKNKEVWNELIPNMPMTALMRNLNKFAAYGVTDTNFSEMTKFIVNKLTDKNEIVKGKLHPFNILVSQTAYMSGSSKGGLTWNHVPKITEALEAAFELSFSTIKPTGKNFYLAVDGSSSMEGTRIHNTNISAMDAATALAMVRARTETNSQIFVFNDGIPKQVNINPKTNFIDAFKILRSIWNGGATNCAAPMIDATLRKMPIDVFEVYTDNETNHGNIHPSQALNAYNKTQDRDAKLIVAGLTTTDFSIADPGSKNMMDVVGFDSAAPTVINNFIEGSL